MRVALVGQPGWPGNRTGAGPPDGVVWPPQADVPGAVGERHRVPGETEIDVGDAMTCSAPVPAGRTVGRPRRPRRDHHGVACRAPVRWKTAPPGAGSAIAACRHAGSVGGLSATAVGPHRTPGRCRSRASGETPGMKVSSTPVPSMFARPIPPPPHLFGGRSRSGSRGPSRRARSRPPARAGSRHRAGSQTLGIQLGSRVPSMFARPMVPLSGQ